MVANESATIIRMLESCYQYIDYWVIQDNGSTDGTQDLIRDFFKEKDIPGFLYEIPWEYPGFNRDHTLQTCLESEHGCDWILRMDADERLEVDEDFDWSIFEDTSIQSFNIEVDSMGVKYYRTWLWNAKLPWFFKHDKRHETIHLPDLDEGFQRVNLPSSFRHVVTNDGQTWYVPRKFLNDALELEKDKIVGNNVVEDLYHLWYLAKSYSDCYGNPEEFVLGKDQSDEFARRCIFYFKQYLKLRHDFHLTKLPKEVDEMGYMALCYIGMAYVFLEDYSNAELHYNLAGPFCPDRNEHLFWLAEMLEFKNRYSEGLKVVNQLLLPERKNPFPKRGFLIFNHCYYDTGTAIVELKKKLENGIFFTTTV